MRSAVANNRVLWLMTGLVAGLAVAYFWPHERAYATNSDRDSRFVMVTVPVGTSAAGINDPMDGLFVLDFLTGQLTGAVLNRQTRKFTSMYKRNLAKDFNVDPQDPEPHYAVATGYAQLAGQGGLTFSSGVLYVGELTSGLIAAYAFPWTEVVRPAPSVLPITPIDTFQWRQPTKKDK